MKAPGLFREKLILFKQTVNCLFGSNLGISMSLLKASLNSAALSLVEKLCSDAEKYNVTVEATESGATLIDAGLNAEGGLSSWANSN